MNRLKRRRLRNQRLLDDLILGSDYVRTHVQSSPLYLKMSTAQQQEACLQLIEHYANFLVNQSYNRSKRANSGLTSFTIR